MRAENEVGFGTVKFFRGEFVDGERLTRRAMSLVDEASAEYTASELFILPTDPWVSMRTHHALLLWQRGDLDEMRRQFADGRRRTADLPFPQGPFSDCYLHSYEAWVLTELGELDAADRAISRLETLAAEHRFDFWAIAGAAARAILTTRRELAGPSPDAGVLEIQSTTLEGSLMMWQMLDTQLLVPYLRTVLGEVRLALGQPHEAIAQLDAAAAFASTSGCRFYLAETNRIRAMALRAIGDDDAADTSLAEALRLAEEQGSVPFAETRHR
ncbi:MAG: hypothetical protein V9G12_25135 [Microthrixaceae bacterium]